MPLSEIWSVEGPAGPALWVSSLWILAMFGAALVRPGLFLRGLDPDLTPDRTRAYAHFYHRMASGVVFGTAAWVGTAFSGMTAAAAGFGWGRFERTLVFILAVLLIALPLMALRSRTGDFRSHYPEIRIRRWTGRLTSNNRTTWLIYAGAYEALLRGVCLFALAAWSGPASALAITVALDVSAHAHRPTDEVIIRLPLAFALGTGALWTGSTLGPWIIHFALILAAESFGRTTRPSI